MEHRLTYEHLDNVLKALDIVPNFYCSSAYLLAAGYDVWWNSNLNQFTTCKGKDKADCLLPNLRLYGTLFMKPSGFLNGRRIYIQNELTPTVPYFCDLNPISSSIDTCKCGNNYRYEFLDYEYIYDPYPMVKLAGSAYSIMRKNIHHFMRIHPNAEYRVVLPESHDLLGLLLVWMNHKAEKEAPQDFYGYDTLISYLSKTKNLSVLVEDGEVLGFNSWDENYKYINFRYSFSESERGVSDFLRWQFYRDVYQSGCRKMVNDGGSLGDNGLRAFKLRLNPVEVNERYTWRKV